MATNLIADASESGTFKIGGDLEVYRMGFGAMRITGEGIWGPPKDTENAKKVLRRTLELGVNFIDTADSYGPNISEELIAEALHPYPAGLIIATKGGLERTGPNQWPVNGRPDHLRQALHGSLKRLKLERIDLYQLHRFDPKVPPEDSLGAIKEMQDQGLIRHVGLSEVDAAQLEFAQTVLPIVSVQNLYNIADRKWDSLVDVTARQNIAFIPWFPLAASPAKLERQIERVAQHHGATTAQVALAWLLHRSPNILPIAGTGSVAHLEENVAASGLVLSDEDMQALNETN
jgi:pyridoxine 4-dehydrogenase